MEGVYDDHGIRFEYPDDWEVEEADDDEAMTVTVNAPSGLAFVIVTADESCPAPAEMADQVLEAMREEYPVLDSLPALETIAGHGAVGHDIEFFSLDMTNTCVVRCFRTPRRTVMVFGQWSGLDDDDAEERIRDIRRTLEETDK